MILGKYVFPISTQVGAVPRTVCQPIDPKAFDFPFFNEGTSRLMLKEASAEECTLEELTIEDQLLDLKGFIFHTSHCGSTLMGQLLKSAPEVRVVSEPEAINGLLISYLFYDLPIELMLDKIRRIIDAYRKPIGKEQFLILKMSSWNIFLQDLFEQAYPKVPWVYIDRPTDQVVNSLLKSDSGMVSWWYHPVDILRRHFVGAGEVFESKMAYLQKLVIAHRAAANKFMNARMLPLEYPDWIDQFESKVLPHFGLSFSKETISQAKKWLSINSKSMTGEKYSKGG